MLYAALFAPPGDSPSGCVWTKQILVPNTRIRAFLRGAAGTTERKFLLDSYLRRGRRIVITTDASPWGLGAVLEIEGELKSFFAGQIHDTDREVLALSKDGASSDQQVLEALALLVALREWSSVWCNQRVQLAVRTDNMAALSMMCRMQPHSERMGIVARELALDICQSSVTPDDCQHIPGISNKAADALSRQYMPGVPPSLPSYLSEPLRHECTPRARDWWRSVPH